MPAKSESTLVILLANIYGLLVKTQCFHWNVKGPTFYQLHKLFEGQYDNLAETVDELAERIRAKNIPVPASLKFFSSNLLFNENDNTNLPADKMVDELYQDHMTVCELIKKARKEHEDEDPATVSFLEDKLIQHEKMAWFLASSQ